MRSVDTSLNVENCRLGAPRRRTPGLLLVTALLLLALPFGRNTVADDEAVNVITPAGDAIVGRTVTVKGTLRGGQPSPDSILRVNGVDVAPTNGQFETTLTAQSDGPLKIRVVYGVPGRPAQVLERVVYVDMTPPSIDLLEPSEKSVASADGEILVRGVVQDKNLQSFTLNETAIGVANGGHFESMVLASAKGQTKLTFVATDRAGNVTRLERVVGRAGPAPEPGGDGEPNRGGSSPPAPGGAAGGRPVPRPGGDSRVAVAFVVDRSPAGSGGDLYSTTLESVRGSAKSLRGDDAVCLVTFGREASLDVPITVVGRLSAAPSPSPARSVDRTGLGAALDLAYQTLLQTEADARHVVLITSGSYGGNPSTSRSAVESARKGVVLSVVALGAASTGSEFSALARAGGGRYYDAAGVNQLDRVVHGELKFVSLGRRKPSPSSPPSPPRDAASPKNSRAVDLGLRWLVAHQSPSGAWEAESFGRWCNGVARPDAGPDGAGRAIYDVGVTGLALLALLEAGYGSRSADEYGRAISKGLGFLIQAQDAEGCFGSRSSGHYVYNHAIATLAMVAAVARGNAASYTAAAQSALDFIAISRNPYLAWRYGIKPGDNDTSVTGWMAMALDAARRVSRADSKSGRPASLQIDEDAFDGIKAWIAKMTDAGSGRVGYQQRGTGPARPIELVDAFPADRSESMTAVGLVLRSMLGEDPRTSEVMRRGVELCRLLPPKWDRNDGSIDMYYWYYGSKALARVGGDAWDQWRAACTATITVNQRLDTDECMYRGSWDPIDTWGGDGGRVYSTAICVLSLLLTQ